MKWAKDVAYKVWKNTFENSENLFRFGHLDTDPKKLRERV
jgi:hypothetical protein